MLKQLPNALTFSRLLLAVPLGMLILGEHYNWALAVGFCAGVSDALDGFAARRLDAFSRLGSILDPIADKTLILVCFVCFAYTGLVPLYVAAVVILRDLVIVAGAAAYHRFIGSFEFSARPLSKSNMGVQICFCILVLAQQLLALPDWLLPVATILVLIIAVVSGLDYVLSWTLKAVRSRKAGSDDSKD
jgi:cardiolipin synthase (CMP-forming)